MYNTRTQTLPPFVFIMSQRTTLANERPARLAKDICLLFRYRVTLSGSRGAEKSGRVEPYVARRTCAFSGRISMVAASRTWNLARRRLGNGEKGRRGEATEEPRVADVSMPEHGRHTHQ